mgnify:CR=1 FL=1
MHIKVYNCNFVYFLSIIAFEICGSYSNIIDVAKAIGLLVVALVVFKSTAKHSSVMTWWSDGAKSILKFSGHNSICGFDN